jgi:hypothetical protein
MKSQRKGKFLCRENTKDSLKTKFSLKASSTKIQFIVSSSLIERT